MSSCIQFGIYAMLVYHIIHIRKACLEYIPINDTQSLDIKIIPQHHREPRIHRTDTREKLGFPLQLFFAELLHQINIEPSDSVTEIL